MADQPTTVTTTAPSADAAPAADPAPVAVEAPVGDAAPVAPAVEPAKTDDAAKTADAKAFAAIAREKRELRAAQEAIKTQIEEVKSFREAIASGDVKAVLRAMGKTESDVLEGIIADGKPKTVEQQLAEMKAALAARDERDQAEAKKRDDDERTAGEKRSYAEDIVFVKDKVAADAAKFPLITKKGDSGADLVRETYLALMKRDGEPPAIADVLTYVEASYRKDAEELATTLGWVKPTPAAPTTVIAGESAPSLSHRSTAAPVSNGVDKYPLDPDKRTRAILEELGQG